MLTHMHKEHTRISPLKSISKNGQRARVRGVGSASLIILLGLVTVAGAASLATKVSASRPEGKGSNSTLANAEMTLLEVQANEFEFSQQGATALDVDGEGRWAVVWESRRQNEGRYGVLVRWFDAGGRRLSGEVMVNDSGPGAHWKPVVTWDGLGGAWVAWEALGQDGSQGAILARRFDPADGQHTLQIAVNELTWGNQSEASIAGLPDGGCVIAWTGPTDCGGAPQVMLRRFDRFGVPTTGEVVLPASKDGRHLPSLAYDSATDQLALAWAETDRVTAVPTGVFAAVLNPDLSLGSFKRVRLDEGKQAGIEPSLAVNREGNVAVAWMQAAVEDYRVFARCLDAELNPLGGVILVDDGQGLSRTGAKVAAALDGGFLVAWNQKAAAGENDQIARRFLTAQGEPGVGGENPTIAASSTQGDRSLRFGGGAQTMEFDPWGGLVFAWEGSCGSGSDEGAEEGDKSAAGVTRLGPPVVTATPSESFAFGRSAPLVSFDDDGLAVPHVPPTFDPDQISIDPFGGDPNPYSIAVDFGFIGIVNTGWTPPDPQMAVGPNHVVLMTNGAIGFFTKTGTKTFQAPIEGAGGFWGTLGATGFVFDPEALYDPMSGRYFAMAAEAFVSGRSFVLFAVSDDSDPNGTWFKYRIDTTSTSGDTFDSPNIGVDAQAVYITGDGVGGVSTYPMYIFDKASILAGNPPAVQKSFLIATSTQSAAIPPVSFDNPPAYYLVEHQEGSNRTQVRLLAVRDPLGTPIVSTAQLTVPTYSAPGDPQQQGTTIRPETFDARFWSAAYRNGSLWCTHHVGGNPVQARWYEIAMNGWPTSGQNPSLVQSGTINPGAGIHTFFTAINVDDDNNACLTFNRSSATEFISIGRAFRLAGDALGTMRPMEIVKDSGGGSTSGRFGDYAKVAPEPAGGAFWLHHEYSPTGGSTWNTWVARVDLPTVNCGDIISVKASCKNGKVKAKIKSSLPGGTAITFVLDGSASATATTKANGTAKAKFSGVPAGAHQVCIQGCPGLCDDVTCS